MRPGAHDPDHQRAYAVTGSRCHADGVNGRAEIATVGNEGVVGVGAVLGVPRSFGRTVVQVGGKAIKVSAKKATRLLCEMPRVSRIFQRYIYAFVRQIAQAGLCYSRHTTEERCARWLLMTHDRAGTDEFVLTQDFLAAMMAARRPTVNLAIAVLRKAGAIEYTCRSRIPTDALKKARSVV